MATFGGTDLGEGGGGVFELASESDDEMFTYGLPDGTEVVIPASSKYVVVRHCPGADFGSVQHTAREAANRAIDVYFGQGGRPLVMAHRQSTFVVWWPSDGKLTARIVSSTVSTSRLCATVTIRDGDGNVVTRPPAPPKAWHESLRYYRVSESTRDLYDSFRNVYLALEALLSTVVPTKLKTNGKPEGDKEWLQRALRDVGQHVDLSPYAPSSGRAANNAIHDELYTKLRTAIFHAKSGRNTWVPQDWQSRSTIVEARARYARLFRGLAAKYLDITYPFGGITRAFWEDIQEGVFSRQQVYVSNDITRVVEGQPQDDNAIAPAGGAVLVMATTPASDIAADWLRGIMGVESGSTVHSTVGEVRRYGSLHDGQLVVVGSLEAPLIVNNLHALEVVILMEGRTYGEPLKDFES